MEAWRKLNFVLVFIIAAGCHNADKRVTADISPDPEIDSLWRIFDKRPRAEVRESLSLDDHWTFVRETDRSSRSMIRLPHRVPFHDEAFIYERPFRIPSPGLIHVRADDGAQLFIDGRQVYAIDGNYFPVDGPAQVTMRVRVLNNAMAGGLRNVTFITRTAFDRYLTDRNIDQRLRRILKRMDQLPQVSQEMLKVMREALTNPDYLDKAEEGVSKHPYVFGPAIVFRDESKTRIAVGTDTETDISLVYGTDPADLDRELVARGPLAIFEVPSGAFSYQVRCGLVQTNVFTLSNRESDQFSFNVWADSQSGWEMFTRNVLRNNLFSDDLSIGVGDLVGEGSDENEWYRLLEILANDAANTPYYLIAGNHDYDGYYDSLKPRNYHRFTGNESTYFSFYQNGCAFIALDPNRSFPVGLKNDTVQIHWLMNQLECERWKGADWRFILLHQPPYSQGWEGYHGDVAIREFLEPLLSRHRVDFVISGHTHDYERLTRMYDNHSVTFIITGGGGGTLEPPPSSAFPVMDKILKEYHVCHFEGSSERIRLNVVSPDGISLDTLVVSR